jgi:type III restriction enzyme
MAHFTADSVLELAPMLAGTSVTHNQEILGEGVELKVEHLNEICDMGR